eukprot:1761130-Rhodomonas_salina.1
MGGGGWRRSVAQRLAVGTAAYAPYQAQTSMREGFEGEEERKDGMSMSGVDEGGKDREEGRKGRRKEGREIREEEVGF